MSERIRMKTLDKAESIRKKGTFYDKEGNLYQFFDYVVTLSGEIRVYTGGSEVFDINDCYLQKKDDNDILSKISKFEQSFRHEIRQKLDNFFNELKNGG